METKKSASAKVSTNDRSKQQLSLIEEFDITLQGDEEVWVRLSKYLNEEGKVDIVSDKLIGKTSDFRVVGIPTLYSPVDPLTGEEKPRYITNFPVIRYNMVDQFNALVKAFAEMREISRGDEVMEVPMIDARVLNNCTLTFNQWPKKDGTFGRVASPGMIVEANIALIDDPFSDEKRVGVNNITLPPVVKAESIALDLESITSVQ